jgi:hypothetical protein
MMTSAATDTTQTLQTFALDDLAQFTSEGAFSPSDSPDSRLFLVGRDDCHGVLMHLYSRVSLSVESSMFGFDDQDLNDVIWEKVEDPNIVTEFVLDKSQSGGVHERQIIASDVTADPAKFAADFVVTTSETSQIVHTKGGILDGLVGYEGSMNWSSSGEGMGIGLHGAANATGFKAQENTLMIFTNPVQLAKLSARIKYAALIGRQRHEARTD